MENAIKHNTHTAGHLLSIIISSDGQTVTVRNNVQMLSSPVHSEKTGLKNLDNFYNFLCDKHISIESTRETFSVRIPIIFEED